MSLFGAIVLRDVPKKEARIDLVRYPIRGGFRGFGLVPPAMWHYVSVEADGKQVGFWCYLRPQQVVVKVYEPSSGFEEADADMEAQYRGLALSGSMGAALIGYPQARLTAWLGLVNKIGEEGFPPQLPQEEAGPGSRFDKILLDTHKGDGESLLAELQYAFLRWLVSIDGGTEDAAAFRRWRHLVLSAYNAGEFRIRESGKLFPEIVDVLVRQYDALPEAWFRGDSFLASPQAGYMSEDMIDTGVPEHVEKGKTLADYLQGRRAGN